MQLLYDSLELKQSHLRQRDGHGLARQLISLPDFNHAKQDLIIERLRKVLNILHFVLGYYGQFKGKL
jgi:hypothetical protein